MAVERKEELYNNLRIHSTDTGSAGVQVVGLSLEIEKLTRHLAVNKKDFSSRKSHLKYLQDTNKELYQDLLKRLNLRK